MELIFDKSKTLDETCSSVDEGVLLETGIPPKTLPIKNSDDDVVFGENISGTGCPCDAHALRLPAH